MPPLPSMPTPWRDAAYDARASLARALASTVSLADRRAADVVAAAAERLASEWRADLPAATPADALAVARAAYLALHLPSVHDQAPYVHDVWCDRFAGRAPDADLRPYWELKRAARLRHGRWVEIARDARAAAHAVDVASGRIRIEAVRRLRNRR